MSDFEDKVEKPLHKEAEVKALTPRPRLGLTREEMNWAAVAHASILVTLLLGLSTGGLAAIFGLAIPAIIWAVYRDKSAYVADQARQATIFQLAGIVALLVLTLGGAMLVVVGWAVTAVLLVILVGLLLVPVMILLTVLWPIAILVLPITQVVYGCYAAAEAYNGRPFRYRWTTDLIDRYESQI